MPQRVESSVVVEAPVSQVFNYWRTLENLPNFMSNIEEVRSVGNRRTHWRVKGPLGAKLEFDAQTTQEQENQTIAWESLAGNIETSAEVRFPEPGASRSRGEAPMNYADPPGGKRGEVGARRVANAQGMGDQGLQT